MDKSQQIRLLDVFAIGPFMILSARYLPPSTNWIMVALGVATIAYNGLNYSRNL